MAIKWKLKKALAERGIWNGQDLVRLLEEKAGIIISHKAVMKLINGDPKAMRFTTLDALCTALDCDLTDIVDYVPEKGLKKQLQAVGEPVAPYRRSSNKPKKNDIYPEEEL